MSWLSRLFGSDRRQHDDRDPNCRYWWGDRGGYPLSGPRAPHCRPCAGES